MSPELIAGQVFFHEKQSPSWLYRAAFLRAREIGILSEKLSSNLSLGDGVCPIVNSAAGESSEYK
jgi:hypothetical protein